MTEQVRFGIVQALAWRVIAELYRRHAHECFFHILEVHPGISVRGQLRLVVGEVSGLGSPSNPGITFHLGGPSGTCDVTAIHGTTVSGFNYVASMIAQDPALTVDRLEAALGLRRSAVVPTSSPSILAVRLMADVMCHEWLARTPLRVTAGWVDASAGCHVAGWTKHFSVIDWTSQTDGAKSLINSPTVSSRMLSVFAMHEAADEGPLLDDQAAFAALDLTDGQLIFGGPAIETKAASIAAGYRKSGRRLNPLVDGVLRHLGR